MPRNFIEQSRKDFLECGTLEVRTGLSKMSTGGKVGLTFKAFFESLQKEKTDFRDDHNVIHSQCHKQPKTMPQVSSSVLSQRPRSKYATSIVVIDSDMSPKNPFTDSSSDKDDSMSANDDPLWQPQVHDSESESSVQYILPGLRDSFKLPQTDKELEPVPDSSGLFINDPDTQRQDPQVTPTFSGLSRESDAEAKKKDKVHYCVFCGAPQKKLARHLTNKHKHEPKVVSFSNAFDKKAKKNELAKLRNSGDYLHNIRVIKEGNGTVVVKRMKKHSHANLGNFIPCPHCFGYFSKKDLWRHQCPSSEKKVKGKKLSRQGALLMPIPATTSVEDRDLLRQVINGMRSDAIAFIVGKDWLLTRLALSEVKKNGFDPDRHNYIREKLREMGRLLEVIRQQTGFDSHGMKDFINPASFPLIVKATQTLSGYSGASTSKYGIPSLALKLGHSLKACAALLMANALENEDDILRRQCEGYLKLHEMKWNEEVSSQALRTLYTRKASKEMKLPLSDDIMKLSTYVSEELKSTQELLCQSKENDVDPTWHRMAKLILVRIILFNRRRQGEVSKMKVKDFLERDKHRNVDIEETLDEIERKMLHLYTLVQIVGKRGRIVPVLLDKEMKDALDHLIRFRQYASILPDNQFVFARLSSHDHIRGSDCLREIISEVDLSSPHSLTSTKLRKQVATMSQVVNLKDHELDLVAKFMGHDIHVHREYYRLPSSTLHIAKVSKLLRAVETGSISKNDTLSTLCSQSQSHTKYQQDQDESAHSSTGLDTDRNLQSAKATGLCCDTLNSEKTLTEQPQSKTKAKRNMAGRKSWTIQEREACLRHFGKHLTLRTLPGKREIELMQQKDEILRQRSWVQIKNFVRNYHGPMKES